MRSTFRDLPIRRQLLLMTLLSSAGALALAGSGFFAWDLYTVYREIVSDVSTQAYVVAQNSSSAIEFADKADGQRLVDSLQRLERVRYACLYTQPDRALLVGYQRDAGDSCPAMLPAVIGVNPRFVETQRPVMSKEKYVGDLLIHRDLDDFYERITVAAITVIGFLLVAIAAAFLIASRMERIIAAPLLNLADTARRVSTTRNYALRAEPTSRDEVGVVVYAFNDMLERIADRTTELSRTNEELEREVQERRRVEGERIAALERERNANRLKDEFLATLSHELRTPLNAVLGWTRVLRTAPVDEATQARALESVERNARAQARLIEDLLEVSRIVTGKLRLRIADVDLAAIVMAAVEVVQPAAAAKRIRLVTRLNIRPAMTVGDPDRLQQIVWNLLSNAVKFTPPEGEVSISLERRQGFVITVRDSGHGIDAKFLPYVFEPFRQADGSPSREQGGLGLGLAIAKRLVELHGGTIRAFSDEGRPGAEFEVHLPSEIDVHAAQASSRNTADARPAGAGGLLQGVQVLVVDDQDDARALLDTALTAHGASVRTAASADEALAAIDDRPPDVLLSDIGMPHTDGFGLIRRLRARPTASGGAIPAIAITAYASLRDRRDAEACGFQMHIAKPFEPDEVARAVARLSRRRKKTVA